MSKAGMKTHFSPEILGHAAILLFLGILTFSGTLRGPFVLDDEAYIIKNPTIKDFRYFHDPSMAEGTGIHPAVRYAFRTRMAGYLSFALNYRLHGLDVFGYHLVNLLIHLGNALLVYALVVLTFRTPYFTRHRAPAGDFSVPEDRDRGTIALFSALLFAIHPVQTQAVTYITQRFASLATLFCLLSLVAYIKSRLSSSPPPRHALYAGSLACALLAMFTKEIAFTLPAALLLYEFLFLEGERKRRILRLVPFLSTMLVIPLTLLAAGGPEGDLGKSMEVLGTSSGMSRWDYLLTQFRVIVTYLRLLVFPANQNLDYDYPVYRSFLDPPVFLSFLFLLAILLLAVWLLLRSRSADSGGRRDLRLVSFGIFWFFLTLSVESSIVPIADVIFEHRVYLPSVGFFTALVTVLFRGKAALESNHPVLGKVAIAALSAVVIVLAAAAYARNGVWGDGVTLWEDAARKSPAKTRPRNNLGNFYQDNGRLEEAVREFQAAIRLEPDLAESHYNLGNAYSMLNRFGEAIPEFQTAIALKSGYVEAHNNLGVTYKKLGNFEEAIREFKATIALQPEHAEAHYNLGNVYALQGRFEEAIREFQAAIRSNPDHQNARKNLNLAIELKDKRM
jgi:tetratricopeptide (TPR) repeat protein